LLLKTVKELFSYNDVPSHALPVLKTAANFQRTDCKDTAGFSLRQIFLKTFLKNFRNPGISLLRVQM
jgi:hypothetical protein